MFQRTTAINKLLGLTARKKIVQGGTWSGKTYGIMAILIDHAITYPGKNITVVAETVPALKKGALHDFKEIMYQTNRWNENNYNGTDRIYTFTNGSTIEFNSFDSVGKAQAAGKRTDLFLNEAYFIPFEIADSLMSRTSENIWIDFNPHSEFWAHTEVLPGDDVDFIILKPDDNEALPESIKKDHKEKRKKAETSEYWANWCRVFLDGEIGQLQGLVFNDWKQVDRFPEKCKWEIYGLDFGFTNDPTTIIRVGYYDQAIYLDEVLYRTGMTNSEIAQFIKSNRIVEVIADSAEPKSIEEIYRAGINIRGATKGKDSINYGIDLMQQYSIFVTKNSINLIKELRNYTWQKDKEGKTLNKPVDMYNHCIDAARYAIMEKLGNKKEFFIV